MKKVNKVNKLNKLSILLLVVGIFVLGCNNSSEVDNSIDAVEDNFVEESEQVVEETIEEETVEEETEEYNPRNMKQVYNLAFDVPIYTDEEVEEARANLVNNYKVSNTDEGLTKDQMIAMGKDYYIANQDAIYQLNDMICNFDIKKCQNSFKSEQPEAIYYDEDNDFYIVINVSEEKVAIYGKNFVMWKYLREVKDPKIGTVSEVNPNNVRITSSVEISTSATYGQYKYEEASDNYLNNVGSRDYAELKEFGYKEHLIENPIITNYDNE